MTKLKALSGGASLGVLFWAALNGMAIAAPAAGDTSATAATQSATAQADAPSGAQAGAAAEVVVTARRSAENLQNVPLTISVTTADQLQTRGLVDLQGLAQYTPNFSFKEFVTSFHGNPTIRGMTQVNTSSAITNAGVFVNGIYLQRDYQENQTLGDFARIELVKGPQSALYGANTFSGAINYVTRAPTDYYTGNAEATIGNAGERRYEAGVGGPIIKGVLDGRFYVGSDDYDGSVKNNAPGLSGSDRYFGGHHRTDESVELKYTPTSNLTFDGFYSTSHRSEGLRPFYTISGKFSEDKTNCGVVNASTGRPSLICGEFPVNPSMYKTGLGNEPALPFSNVNPDSLINNEILKFGAQWVINSAFIANYTFGDTLGNASEALSFFTNTYDPIVQPAVANTFNQQFEGAKIHYISHEIRLNYDQGGPFKFEVGYSHTNAIDRYYFGIKAITITGGVLPPFVRQSDNNPFLVPPGTIPLNNLDQTFTTDSVFGRGSYTFFDDRATATAEFRYTETSIKFNDLIYLTKNPTAAPLQSTYDDPVPRFTLQYKLSPTSLIYTSAAEGVKTGGFNGYSSGTLTLLPSDQAFGEEKNWTYELGSKNTFLDHKLLLNADVFYIDWFKKLAQLTPTNLPPQTSGAQTTVATIYKLGGGATNYGIEIDGQYRPIPPLTLTFSGAAQDPRYDKGSINTGFIGYCTVGTCPVNGDISNHHVERVSNYSGSAGAEYRDHLTADWDYFGGVEATYQSKQYTDQMNLGYFRGFALFNAQLGVESERWKAFFWAKNLGDKLYIQDVFYVQSASQYTATYGERRTYGITLTGKF